MFEELGLTSAGYYKSIRQNSLRLKTIEQIAVYLNVNICQLICGSVNTEIDNKIALLTQMLEQYVSKPEVK
jgi:hypothetical protein